MRPVARLALPSSLVALAAAALLALPAVSGAAVTFGSPLRNDPNTSGCDAACTIVAAVEPAIADPLAPPDAGGAPIDGVITTLRLREIATAATQVTFRLADITVQPHDPDPPTALATAVATGPTITVQANPDDARTLTAAARMPVKRGQHLAIDATPDLQAIYATDGSPFGYVFQPVLVPGRATQSSSVDGHAVNEQMLVQAVAEPDADHDGYGDDTQDSCPSQAGVHAGPCVTKGPPPPLDTTPPAIRGMRVAGGAIAYALSEPASVSVRIDRATSGRRVHGACVRATRANRHARRCTRFAALLRSLHGPGATGADRLVLPRIHGRKIGRGLYRLTLTARDRARNATTITKQFRVTH
jgi:hypothetical protein